MINNLLDDILIHPSYFFFETDGERDKTDSYLLINKKTNQKLRITDNVKTILECIDGKMKFKNVIKKIEKSLGVDIKNI